MLALKKAILFVVLCFSVYTASAQNDMVFKADSLYLHKRFKQAATLYFTAFAQDRSTRTDNDLFVAAKASARAHYPDSAFRFLFLIVAHDSSTVIRDIIDEPDLQSLHPDKQWTRLTIAIKKQQSAFNRPVADELIALSNARKEVDEKQKEVLTKYTIRSLRFRIFRDSVEKVDTVNFYKWRSIINTYSWPTRKSVGKEGIAALMYLYQHTNIRSQKIYFPLVGEAFKRGDVDGTTYAVIADRIALYDTGRQIYGTQFKQNTSELFPVNNKDSLNIRRSFVGLEPIVQ